MSNVADGMLFSAFAANHAIHKHCASCAGCILDRRDEVMNNFPVWCLACVERIEATTPAERWPWGKYGRRVEPEVPA